MTCKIVKAPTDIPRIMESPRCWRARSQWFDFERGRHGYTYLSPCGLLRATPEELRLRLTISSFASRRSSGPEQMQESTRPLVTFLYPTRLTSDARRRAGVRLALGPLRP